MAIAAISFSVFLHVDRALQVLLPAGTVPRVYLLARRLHLQSRTVAPAAGCQFNAGFIMYVA